jgi:hypothetical protein
VITWYHGGEGYVPEYRQGMRLVFFADNATNPWGIHAFGNEDWHVSASPQYYYYYQQGNERYPTTTGLSVQYVSEIQISSKTTTLSEPARTAPTTLAASPTKSGISLFTIIGALAVCGFVGSLLHKRA